MALVLAGGGARGAYEIGALSVLLPALPAHERPRIVVGTSVGAINAAYLAAAIIGQSDEAVREIEEPRRIVAELVGKAPGDSIRAT